MMEKLELASYPAQKDTGEWIAMIEVSNFHDEPDCKAFSAEFNECGEIVFVEVTFTPDH